MDSQDPPIHRTDHARGSQPAQPVVPTPASWATVAPAYLTLVTMGILAGFVRDFSGDFHWHVVLGSWTLDHREFPRSDTFSFTFLGHRQYLDSWLGDVLLAAAYRADGYVGCYFLRGAAIAATLVLLAREMVRSGVRIWTAAVILAAILGELLFRLYLRPETLSFALLAALLVVLGEHERRPRWRWVAAVFPLIALWANLHGSVLIGLLVVGFYALERFARAVLTRPVSRTQLLPSLALPAVAFLASLANPEGIREPLMFLFVRGDDPTFGAGVEWRPFEWATMSDLFPFLSVAMLLVILAAGRRVSVWRLALVASLAFVTLRHGRFIKATLLCAAPLVAIGAAALRHRLLDSRALQFQRWVGRGAVGAVALAASFLLLGDRRLLREVGTGLDPGAYPEQACRFAREWPLGGRMLNSFDFGSYLLFCLPDHPVFIDQRAAILYTPEFTRGYYALARSPQTLQDETSRWGISWGFMAYDPIAFVMAASPATWRLLYFDDLAMIYVRADDPRVQPEARASFRYLNPLRLVSLVNAPVAVLDEARSELAVQRSRCPDCYRTHTVEAALALAAHDATGFQAAMRPIADQQTPEVVFLFAVDAARRGDLASARRYLSAVPVVGVERAFIGTLSSARPVDRTGRTPQEESDTAPVAPASSARE